MYCGVPSSVPELGADDLSELEGVGLHLGDAEVDELGDLVLALAREEDVARLQIAMDDAHGVRLADAARHLAEDLAELRPA